MTTPVRGRSLTQGVRTSVGNGGANQMGAGGGSVPPPPIIPPTPDLNPPALPRARKTRLEMWRRLQKSKHPFMYWVVLITVSITLFLIVYNLLKAWPVFRGYFGIFALFWFFAIGMMPFVAVAHTGANLIKEMFDND